METRFNLSKQQLKEQNKRSTDKAKELFFELSREFDIPITDINMITVGCETFYNPFLYKYYNKHISRVNDR